MIDVYVCEPSNKQYVKTIDNELKAFQEIVGGNIEVISLGKYVIVCDEEAKLKQKKPSIHMDVDFIAGTSFFAKTDNDQFVTLDASDIRNIERYMKGESLSVIA